MEVNQSVHNAPAGYWGIAFQSRESTTSLCAYDASFAVGLVHAAAHVVIDGRVVALIAYDLPYLEPLCHVRPIISSFATALVLTHEKTERAIACLEIRRGEGGKCISPVGMDPGLEELAHGVPAARSLPLLLALASGNPMTVDVEELPEHRLVIQVSPC